MTTDWNDETPLPGRTDGERPGEDDAALRPSRLADFVGQGELKDNLRVFLDGARGRGEALDHALLHGEPGLGKTTLARILSNELGVGFRALIAPAIQKAAELASVLVTLEPRDVLFVDEIHRLPPAAAEILYPAMEDFSIDLMVGDGPNPRPVSIPLPPFTLVGATTRPGMLPKPLRDRFHIKLELQYYTQAEMEQVVRRDAALLGFALDEAAVAEVARRTRGTPRVAVAILRRLRDFAQAGGAGAMDAAAAGEALRRLKIDRDGLEEQDRKYLRLLAERYRGRAVGLKTIAAALGEDVETVESMIEPYLLRQGYIERTPQGRVLSPGATAECLADVPRTNLERQRRLLAPE